ncbi:hypothetical protein KEM52_004170 [Ascosphaera acerosa]|nr:hypothetical protein KEM52_004170 [Ascosphaera acerosa]
MYVKNFDTTQLNIGIWSGDVKLRDLELRREALDQLHLPLNVVEGYLGELTLSIPWSNLRSKPVRVNVRDVFLLAAPRMDADFDPADEKRRAQALKIERLDNADLLREQNGTSGNGTTTSQEEQLKNQSFTESLVNAIVDNLQVVIENVHVRYEDAVACPGSPFAVGLTVRELSAVSTDEEWNPTFIQSSSGTSHKLATLESLAMYWDTQAELLTQAQSQSRDGTDGSEDDHTALMDRLRAAITSHETKQHMLKPVSCRAGIELDKTGRTDRPRMQARFLFDELAFVLDDAQYRDALMLTDLFHSYYFSRENRELRPATSPKDDPAAWFRYAGNVVLHKIHDRNRRWTWDYMRERRDDRKAYIALYKQKKRGDELAPDDQDAMTGLEEKYAYEDLRFWRSLARSQLRKERVETKHNQPQQQQKQTWSEWFWGAKKEAEDQTVMSEEQKQELFQAIDWDEKRAAAESIDVPREWIKFQVNVSLSSGSLTLKRDPHGTATEIIRLMFDRFRAKTQIRPDSFTFAVDLGGLRLYDGSTRDTLFPQVIKVKDAAAQPKDAVVSPHGTGGEELNPAEQPVDDGDDRLFHVFFENNPLDGSADTAVTLRLKSVEVIYNPNMLVSIYNFLLPPRNHMESINALLASAGATVEEIRQQTRAGLEFALQEHKTCNAQFDVQAPLIIVPYSVVQPDPICLIIDAGHIALASELVPKETLKEIEAKQSEKYNEQDYERLESLMYDKFTIQLDSTQALIGRGVDATKRQLDAEAALRNFHIIDRISMDFLLELCIVPSSPDLTRTRVSGKLPQLHASLSDRKYKDLMRIIDIAIPQFAPSEPAQTDTAEEAGRQESSAQESQQLPDIDAESVQDVTPSELRDTRQRLFELKFTVDRLVGSLYRSGHSEADEDILLCEAVATGFHLDFVLRPDDMSADVALQSLSMDDHIERDAPAQFKQIVTSKVADPNEQRALFVLKVTRQVPSSPQASPETKVDLAVSTISLVVTRRTILTLLDFTVVTFTETPAAPAPHARRGSSVSAVAVKEAKEAQQAVSNIIGKVQVACKLDGISLVLNDDGARLATLSMTTATISVKLTETIQVHARMGSLNLYDDLHSEGSTRTVKRLMSIEGDDFADLMYRTFDPQAAHYPGYSSEVYLRSGSVKVNFVEEPYRRIVNFLVRFGKMQAIFNAARLAAANQANQIQESAQYLHFDVVMKAPILVFPRVTHDQQPKDYIAVNLGEFHASNTFKPLKDEPHSPRQNCIKAGIRHIKLSSSFSYGSEVEELEIMENVDVDFDINYMEHDSAHERPETIIDGTMSPINLRISQAQVKFILYLIQTVPAALIPDPGRQEAEAYHSLPPNITEPAQAYIPRPAPELREAAQVPEMVTSQDNVWTQLQMNFKAPTIGLELILAREGEKTGDLDHASLSKCFLSDTKVKLHMSTNGAMETEVTIQSFNIRDSRMNADTRFRKIMSLINSEVQQEFIASISLSGGERRHVVVMLTIDSPRIILALDHLIALQRYTQEAFAVDAAQDAEAQLITSEQSTVASQQKQSSSSQGSAATQGQPQAANTTPITVFYRVNIVDTQMILVANPAIPESEAIVLNSKELMLSQQNSLTLRMRKVGMFLCRMDNFESTRLRILDDFGLTMSLDTQASGTHGPSTRIDLHADPLVLRLSLRDIVLAIQIVNKASEMFLKTSVAVQETAPPQLAARRQSVLAERPKLGREESFMSGSSRRSSSTRASRDLPVAAAHNIPAVTILQQEEMTIQVDGLRIVIIGEGHELPLFDWNTQRFDVAVRDWSSHVCADANISTHLNVYNFSKSAWEPLMEPYQIGFHVQKDLSPECTSLQTISSTNLELTLSSSTISLISKSLHFLQTDEDMLSKPRGSSAPYRLRNYTGFDMKLWTEYEKGSHGPSMSLEDGKDLPWQFEDPIAMRENLTPEGKAGLVGLQLEGSGFDVLHAIPLIREGEFAYNLRPKSERVSHRLLVEVLLGEDYVKYITFRSPVLVENNTQIPIEVGVYSPKEGHLLRIEKIPPGESRAAPVGSAYLHSLVVRPDQGFGYEWSSEILYWKDLIRRPTRGLSCRSEHNPRQQPPFYFQLHAAFDRKDPAHDIYPNMRIKIFAPIEIQNLLPYDFKYRLYDKNTRKDWTNFLRKGGISPVHVVELSHLLLLNIDIEDTPFRQGEFAIINGDIEEDFRRETSSSIDDGRGTTLRLGLHYHTLPDSGGAFKVSVYCPYVILNKTGLNINLKSKGAPRHVQGHRIKADSERGMRKTLPHMYSYSTQDRRNRTLLKLDISDWTKPQSFEAIGSNFEAAFPSLQSKTDYYAGISVTEGQGKYLVTKVITITPRFILRNQLNEDLIAREPGSSNVMNLRPGDLVPLHFLHREAAKQLCLAFPGLSNQWSSPFHITDMGSVYAKVAKAGQSQKLLKVDILLEGATIFFNISLETSHWPFSMRNESDIEFTFYQADPNMEEDEEVDEDSTFRPIRYRLPPRSIMPYAWDYPASRNKLLVLVCRGRERYIKLAEIGNLMPMRVPPAQEGDRHRNIDINIVADGPTQTLVLSNFKPSKSMYRQPTGMSSRSSMTGAFEVKQVQSEPSLKVQLRFNGLGISLINSHLKELVYMTFRDIEFRYTDSSLYQTLDLTIKWIQFDNQLYGGVFPLIMYPSVVPKNGQEMDAHPIFHTKVTRVKDDSYGVLYIKYATLLCQQMTIEVDEDFIFAMLEFVKAFGVAAPSSDDDQKLCDETLDIPEPQEQQQTRDVYFELLHLHPVQLDLSFVRTERVNVESGADPQSPLMFFVNILTMSIGNVNDAPVRLNALMLENARISMGNLMSSIVSHYSQEVVRQIHLILGSADFLGNPVGLFNTFSSAVSDFFYEPYQGLVMGDRPHEQLGIGIAKGTSSLVKKSVFGISDSVTKFTGSISKGLAAATLDKEFQDQRRMTRARNRPKHALYGIASGGNAFAQSLASGIGGLARHPLEGAEKEGLQGFVKGIGKGLLGLPTKSVIGAFDFASSLAEGVRNTTTVFDANDLDRVRYPRFIGVDGVVRPYSGREALGQYWLKTADDGRYFHEDYIAHLDIPGQSKLVILTYNRILVLRTRGLRTELDIQLTDIQTISKERTGMSLTLKGGVSGPFIPVPDEGARNWLYRQIAIAVNAFNDRYGARD